MPAARVLLLGVGSAALAHALLLRRLLARWRKGTCGGLDSLVSFSSRLIAAARAVESLRPDAFVVDPLAWILAGPAAMARCKDAPAGQAVQATSMVIGRPPASSQVPADATLQQELQPLQGPQQQQQQQQQLHGSASEPRPVPRLIMRTCFFDDAAMAAVGSPAQRSLQCLAPMMQYLQQQGLPRCHQVVLLGSGMDTRPWRLDLPPAVAWFEVDRRDVLAAKQAELTRAGVQLRPCRNSSSSSSYASTARHGRSLPLKASSWACTSADLQLPGWATQLVSAGLDVTQPVAWLAEGLLYYLEPDCVGPMLKEAASISPPGSIFVSNFLLAEGIALLHSRTEASSSSRTAAAAAGSADTSCNAAGDPNNNAAENAASSNSGNSSSSSSSSSSKSRGSGLMSQFKWGCPEDVQQFWSAQGWHLLQCDSWRQAAAQYGWQPQVNAAAADRPPTQEVQFAVAVVAPVAASHTQGDSQTAQ